MLNHFNHRDYKHSTLPLMPIISVLILFLFLPTSSKAMESICAEEFTPASGSHNFQGAISNSPDADAQIKNIYITRLKIFDESNPAENNWVYRWANRFHILTKEQNIKQELLFKEDEKYHVQNVEESARLLRKLGHLYDASIRVIRQCEADRELDNKLDTIDLEVITRDIWSLNIDASFGRSGSENTHRFGLSESNLFGTGKEISIINKKNSDRESTEFTYKDNNVMGSRVKGLLRYADSDDGSHELFQIGLPFFALDARSSWGLRAENFNRIDTQYFKGNDLTETRHNIEDYNLHVGFSSGLQNGLSRRWVFGYRYREDTFSPGDNLPGPAEAPRNQTLSYPYIQYEVIENNYTTAFNLDQLHRTEDLHLGYSFRHSFGYAASKFGSDIDRIVTSGEFKNTLLFNDHFLIQHRINWQGQWNLDEDLAEDTLLSYKLKYFRRQTAKRSFVASFSAVLSENLNSNTQLVLGGDTGLRGYENRLQVGDRRFVLSLEERQYTNYQLLNLAYLGFAAFFDMGRAWKHGVDDGLNDNMLANVGFGIRLASTKANGGRVIHLDFAFPITNRDDPEVDNFQVLVTIKNSL